MSVRIERERLSVWRGASGGIVSTRRCVTTGWADIAGVSVRHLGRLPFVAVVVVGAPIPLRPFDDWAIPMDTVVGAEELAAELRARSGAYDTASSA